MVRKYFVRHFFDVWPNFAIALSCSQIFPILQSGGPARRDTADVHKKVIVHLHFGWPRHHRHCNFLSSPSEVLAYLSNTSSWRRDRIAYLGRPQPAECFIVLCQFKSWRRRIILSFPSRARISRHRLYFKGLIPSIGFLLVITLLWPW